jgi:transcriptional regulator with XRE-family HTH domain
MQKKIMDTQIQIEKRIGNRVREFRKVKHMTISQLSKITDISEAQLSRIENGKTSTPVSTLDIIAKALGTKIGFLFDEDKGEDDPKVVVTKSNERMQFRRGMQEFGYNYEAIAAKKKNKVMEPFILRIDKHKSPDQPVVFTHPGEEVIFVLQGEMFFTYEDQRCYLEKGDCIYFDATGNHMVRNIGDTDLEFMIVICSP